MTPPLLNYDRNTYFSLAATPSYHPDWFSCRSTSPEPHDTDDEVIGESSGESQQTEMYPIKTQGLEGSRGSHPDEPKRMESVDSPASISPIEPPVEAAVRVEGAPPVMARDFADSSVSREPTLEVTSDRPEVTSSVESISARATLLSVTSSLLDASSKRTGKKTGSGSSASSLASSISSLSSCSTTSSTRPSLSSSLTYEGPVGQLRNEYLYCLPGIPTCKNKDQDVQEVKKWLEGLDGVKQVDVMIPKRRHKVRLTCAEPDPSYAA